MIPGVPPEPPPGTPGGPGYIPPGLPGSPEYIIPGMPGSPEYHAVRRRANGSGAVDTGHRKFFGLGAVAFVILFAAALAFIVFVALNVFGTH